MSWGAPWAEWSIQGCASQSWTPPQGRCRTSAGRQRPGANRSEDWKPGVDRCFFLIIILNYLFFHFLWPGVPGEASVGTRIGENRLPAGRGKPRRLLGSQDRGSRIGSLSCGIWYDKVKNLQDKQCGRTYKEEFGRSGPPLPGSDNPCWGRCAWLRTGPLQAPHYHRPAILPMKGRTKRRGFTLFFSNNFWVLSLCSCCMAVPVVSQNLTEPSACPVTGRMNSQLLKLQDELSLT